MSLPSTVHVFSQGVEPDDYPEITEGSQIHTDPARARPIHTTGHGPDHVSYYLPDQGLLFSGNALHAPRATWTALASRWTTRRPGRRWSAGDRDFD